MKTSTFGRYFFKNTSRSATPAFLSEIASGRRPKNSGERSPGVPHRSIFASFRHLPRVARLYTFALRAAVTKVACATSARALSLLPVPVLLTWLVLFSWRLCEAAELHGAVQQTGIQDADGLRMTAARKMEMSRVRRQASQSHDRRVPWRLARLQAASTIVCSLHIKAILSAKLLRSSSDGQWSNHRLQC